MAILDKIPTEKELETLKTDVGVLENILRDAVNLENQNINVRLQGQIDYWNAEKAKQEEQFKRQAKLVEARTRREEKIKAAKEEHDAKLAKDEYKNASKSQQKLLKLKYDLELKNLEKLAKNEEKIIKKQLQLKQTEAGAKSVSEAFSKNKTLRERAAALANGFKGSDGSFSLAQGLASVTSALSDFAKGLEKQIDTIAGYQGKIDTRLQGSKNATKYGSYWSSMVNDVTKLAAVSPYVKQETINANIQKMVNAGISYNVEQRAFLMTISDKIADTFNAANGTLLRLVRVQQQDSTAARLGMESSLTAYLNNMFENTEYLGSIMDGVKGQLEEAEALMSLTDATAFEYQAQKWLGSLYSVGMSQQSISGIATALGQVASGNISGLSGSGTGNLLLMAAQNAGLSVSEMMADGLDESETNKLLGSMVSYLQQIAAASSGNKLLQQQYASIFGLSASDIKAATNLSSSMKDISSSSLSYGDALNRLSDMAGSIGKRTSIGEMMTNMADNFSYTLAAGIADSAALYGIYKTASLLDTFAGGVPISAFGVSLKTSDALRSGAMGASIIKGIGSMFSGKGAFGNINNALEYLGAYSGNAVTRGSGTTAMLASGSSTSTSGFIGNSDGSNLYNSTLQSMADDNANAAAIQGQESTVSENTVNESIVSIYNLLKDVTNGSATLAVKMENYGLSWN